MENEGQAKDIAKNEPQEEATSFVEQVLDGETHSPEIVPKPNADPEAGAPVNTDSARETDEKSGEDNEQQLLRATVDRLDKRLKDTQRRLHDECAKRSELQKELEAFKERESNEDWFSAADTSRRQEVEKELADSEERLRKLDEETRKEQEDANVQRWDQEAALVERKHPDFKERVYGYLGDFIDEKSDKYDVAIHRAWLRHADKSPAGAYQFASDLSRKLAALEAPNVDGPRTQFNGSQAPTGRVGLDMVNSEFGPSNSGFQEDTGFVEQIFK